MKDKVERHDADVHKGAVEDDHHNSTTDESNTSMSGQLRHRHQDKAFEGLDSDYPEPGESPEHS
ncbi:MAG: hypothetical protein HYX26_02355 [Acidobacteriales bacterium]|nr:hypothetical protein [Terriglobales bacterium]